MPSAPSQEKAIEEALARARICPSDMDYLEAHGTGTVVGDPIELNAATAVYGMGREKDNPLLIGSVKTNIGHLGPAAGVAGLIKSVLAMRHGVIPKHLNFRDPNPRIDWENLPVRVTDTNTAWPVNSGRLPLSGINSFGWSGTNSHVVVEGYGQPLVCSDPATMAPPSGPELTVPCQPASRDLEKGGERETRVLPLSAKSPEALRDMATQYLAWLDEQGGGIPAESTGTEAALADAAWTAAVGRSHFSHRAGVVFSEVAHLREALKSLADGDGDSDRQTRAASKVAFVFTGQGAQWVGMGKKLYEREPVFRAVLDQCDRLLFEERGVSLLDVMFGRNGTEGLLDEPKWTQPAIYSLEAALTALWASVGIKPDVVVGHSLGEIAASQAAGVFNLEQGLRFTSARGTLLGSTREDGAMAAVFAPASRVAAVVEEHNANSDDVGLSVAVDNGLQQVVSGPGKDVDAVVEIFEAEDVKVRRLRKSPAYHSALMEPALDDLAAAVGEIAGTPPAPSVPLISDLNGRPIGEDERMDAAYWRRHAREPVAFRSCVETLAEMGVEVVVELGPHAILEPVVSMTWPEASPSGTPIVLQSLRRPPRDPNEPVIDTGGGFVAAVAGAYEAGLPIRFEGLFSGEERRRVSLPTYAFQRKHHWVQTSKRRRQDAGHPLLGTRHESPRGEVMFETEMFPSDPAWLVDHLVYDRIVAPGALYGAMPISASLAEHEGLATVDDVQMHSALIFDYEESEEGGREEGRKLQLILDAPADSSERGFQIFSKGETEEGWTLHAEGRLSSGLSDSEQLAPVNPDEIKDALEQQDTDAFYRMRWSGEIHLGPSYHSLRALWAREGESLGELALQESVDAAGIELHPLLLDGCFQISAIARHMMKVEQGAVYLPFGWERLWVSGPMPERILCHSTLRNPASRGGVDSTSVGPPETVVADVRFYSMEGAPLGALMGYTAKRATRAALLSARDSLKDILYEVLWRGKPLTKGMPPADFLADPARLSQESRSFNDYLLEEGVESRDRADFLKDLERLSQSYALNALERLGWERKAGETVSQEELIQRLKIANEHQRLLGRLLGMLSEAGVISPFINGFQIEVGAGDLLPDEALADPESLADEISTRHPHGANELGLLRRCGASLDQVLQGSEDPLGLLFSDEGPSAADLYLKAPASRAANQMLADAVAAAVSDLPEDRVLRILEVGAGTGSATTDILPLLPSGRFEYTFTDISAGFFTEAESRLSKTNAPIEYKPLNIEIDPVSQGFDGHGYDLVIAANVLHATRDLGETLAHCRDLLAPSGQMLALEGLRRRAWQDLTFGLLDGWWRFADSYRPEHALATPQTWKQALSDVGYSDVGFIGPVDPYNDEPLGSGVIMARGPSDVALSPGAWVIAADEGGTAAELAAELASRGQSVVLAGVKEGGSHGDSRVSVVEVEATDRESWRSVLEGLSEEVLLKGVVHLAALDGYGASATTGEMAEDVTRVTCSALALAQGIVDAGVMPSEGVWLVTRGAQVLEQEFIDRTTGELAGATLWGFGKVMAGEAAHLQPRLIDLDPRPRDVVSGLVDELLSPDSETNIAYRGGNRLAARLVRGVEDRRLVLPEGTEWGIGPEDPEAGNTVLRTKPRPKQALEPGEVRIAVESMGLNFADMLMSIGAFEYTLEIGREAYGRILETAEDVESFSVGDAVVAVGFSGFTPEMVTKAVLAAPAPEGFPATALATAPICFVTAELAFELSRLKAGERVLIHAGAGGVGLAAIQLAQAVGAEVFATASVGKQAYLRDLGVKHVFDSRQTNFGEQILEATGGKGVHVVLNSLTGEGFIEASLSCLGKSGRFVEIAKRRIYSEEEMSVARPDVDYHILDVDTLKRVESVTPGASLTRVMKRLSAGELNPLPHTVWPLTEIRSAMDVMREARHIGKNVFRMPPLARGTLRDDRSYLVTGGMGGIGCEVARWLAENGATTIVLNGRREPDLEAVEVIKELRESGVYVRVEIADVTDFAAVDEMLARIEEILPALGGVVHSVGVLSDGAIENQTWERFEQVMWPKVLGAWHLHKATIDKDLDMFILFSSVTGVIGNPGQSNHAAANAFLDQLAAHRRMLGLPAQSIAWGAWSGIGEAEEQRDRIERQLESTGAGWIAPQQGIKALDWLVRQDVTTPTVTAVDWSVVTEETEASAPFFEELLVKKRAPARETEEASASSGLLAQLREAPEGERQKVLSAFLQDELKSVMRLGSPPSPTVSFFDLGMDSLMAVELRNRINRALAGEYTASNTVVFDYPNAAALASHLSDGLGALAGSAPNPVQSAPPARPKVRRDEEAIAIVGMACRFPGAPDIDSFWRQLESGGNAVTEGRLDSGSWEGVLGDPAADDPIVRRGAFVEGIDLFDSRFFKISPIEARMMDPQQRMLLETSWQALEDAGIDAEGLKGSRTGVYAGVGGSEYRDLISTRGQEYSYAGTNGSLTVGRVAFALGLEGPAMPIDVACASSLAAVHQAVVGLQRGEVDMALAGGVNAILSPKVSKFFNDLGVLSASGQCYAFDAAADGFVRGEGCGMIVLKRLSDAEADGDRIWGVVLGTAVNQNGVSAGLMAPNGPAQERVMQDALSRADVAASDIDYLEAQGVGSQFGDPIELNAVAEVYGKGRAEARPLYVGSVKTNIGHLEWASGVASLIKTVLAMRRRVIPRHLNFKDPNPHVDWDRLDVQVTSEAVDWPACPEKPPLAAVNSFGLSGANAHVVVGGYESAETDNRQSWPVGPAQPVKVDGQPIGQGGLKERGTRLLPLSGKTPEALRELAQRYAGFLDERDGELSAGGAILADITWSAGVGRSHFSHRAGIAFSNVDQLQEGLAAVANGDNGRGDREVPEMLKAAFVFTGENDGRLGLGRDWFETEPVVREVLDRCNEIFLKEQGLSLLNLMSERAEGSADPVLAQVAVYALECALAALWRSLGVSPGAVVGDGLGLISAAQAAGVLDLVDGLRIVASVAEIQSISANGDNAESLANAVAAANFSLPTVPIVNGATGQVIESGEAPGVEFWKVERQKLARAEGCAKMLAELGVVSVIAMGAGDTLEDSIRDAWPVSWEGSETPGQPVVLTSFCDAPDGNAGFMKAVAKAYESGLDLAFTGLFAGEARRRVPLPGYPFQRRRHWVDAPRLTI